MDRQLQMMSQELLRPSGETQPTISADVVELVVVFD